MSLVTVVPADIQSEEALALITALNTELQGRYPEEGANHFRLDPEEVAPGRGAFFIARSGSETVGCGAFRLLDPQTAEIKRMYTKPEARGKGSARAILATLETAARAIGATRLVLETGIRQPEAIALYERAGFARVETFGEYTDSPLSVCLAKTL